MMHIRWGVSGEETWALNGQRNALKYQIFVW